MSCLNHEKESKFHRKLNIIDLVIYGFICFLLYFSSDYFITLYFLLDNPLKDITTFTVKVTSDEKEESDLCCWNEYSLQYTKQILDYLDEEVDQYVYLEICIPLGTITIIEKEFLLKINGYNTKCCNAGHCGVLHIDLEASVDNILALEQYRNTWMMDFDKEEPQTLEDFLEAL